MTNVVKRVNDANGNLWGWQFFCPGCKETHMFFTSWQFDGNMEKPTVVPSIKVTWPANPQADDEYKEWRKERVCHSFIKNGIIEFCGDCTHDMKDQKVALPPIEEDS